MCVYVKMKQFDNGISEEFLIRYLLKETGEQENYFLEQAIVADPAIEDELQKLRNVLDMVSLTRIDTEAAWNSLSVKLKPKPSLKVQQTKHRTFSIARLAVAASILIVIGLTAFFGYNMFMSKPVTTQTFAETAILELHDGSMVTLNRESELRYPRKFTKDQRTVHLKGEAFFEVEPDPDKPFVVETADLTVTVLGTSFYVRAFPGHLPEVLVETGVVQCHYKPTGETIILQEGETAIFGRGNAGTRKASIPDLNSYAWKTYNLRFENESLNNIVLFINRAYGSQLEIEGNIGECRLTVNFNNLNIDGVLNVLQSILDVRYTRGKQKIILSGEGC